MWEQFSSPDENWVFYLRVVSDASFWELFQIIDCQEAVIGRLSTRSFLRGFKFFKNYSSSASPILRLEYKVIKYHFIGYSNFKLSCYYATIVVISLASVSLRLRSVFACLVKWVTPPSKNSLKLFRNKLRCEPKGNQIRGCFYANFFPKPMSSKARVIKLGTSNIQLCDMTLAISAEYCSVPNVLKTG